MSDSIQFSDEALAEFAEAADWYESRQTGLGFRLLDEVEKLLPLIASLPGSFPLLADISPPMEVRRALLSRFPYALVFRRLGEGIRIIAFAHFKRKPGYWLDRLENLQHN